MLKVIKYTHQQKEQWDAFVSASKNGTFMLMRGYMDYHSDRFVDNSLLFYDDDKLVALLPASLHEQELRSHGGLTYGGIIVDKKMTVQLMLSIFDVLLEYMRHNNITKLIYKRVPAIYYAYPSDEDLYALFRNDAELYRRDIASTIYLSDRIRFSERRRRGVKNAAKNGVIVRESNNYEEYLSILSEILSKYHNAKPVHTADEIKLLANRFPENIRLFAAYKDDVMIAGIIAYITSTVVHAQYIANSDEGRQYGALDAVVDFMISSYSATKQYLDFGISTEKEGRFLNEGLVQQKQEFGGRAIAYDFYELKV